MRLSPEARDVLEGAFVAHLATADAAGVPSCVPVCFARDGETIVIALDEKPKDVPVAQLKRVRNIQANPHVSFLIDHYEDDWSRLWYLQIRGEAHIELTADARSVDLLRARYAPYRTMPIERSPLIRIHPTAARLWRPSGSVTRGQPPPPAV